MFRSLKRALRKREESIQMNLNQTDSSLSRSQDSFNFFIPRFSLDKSRNNSGKFFFLVTSWGHAGSIWLAGSLNLHQEICSTVGVGHPIQCFNAYNLHKDVEMILSNLDVGFLRYGFHGPTAFIPKQLSSFSYVERDLNMMPFFIIDELAEIPYAKPFKAVGNVHGITVSQLFDCLKTNSDPFKGRPVCIVDLIRHPVGRTESAIKATLSHIKNNSFDIVSSINNFISHNAKDCLTIERNYGIDLDEPRTRAAFHVYRQGLQNDVWTSEIKNYPQVYRILLERLQNEPEYFAHVFYLLSSGQLMCDSQYLQTVFAPENLGSGRQTQGEVNLPPKPSNQYELWPAWEKEEFARVAHRLEMFRYYLPFGYDFSFVTRKPLGGGSWFEDMKQNQ